MRHVDGNGTAPVSSPDLVGKCLASFSYKLRQKHKDSPEHEKVPYITIVIPGGEIVERKVTENDKMEYPYLWDKFLKGEEKVLEGWPIDKVPFLSVEEAAAYKFIGILTLESLAGAPDTALQGIMGAMSHREKAKVLINRTEKAKPSVELASRCEQLESKIQAQSAQIKELVDELKRVKEGQKATPVAEDKS